LVYVSVQHDDQFAELYGVRKKIRKLVSWRKEFMEDLANRVFHEFPDATEVRVTLLFSRHVVIMRRN
jgi:hypothetical protein